MDNGTSAKRGRTMNGIELPPESEMAFHSADKTKINKAVLAVQKELGLSQGSVTASSNLYKSYDLYSLLRSYITDPHKRVAINKIIEGGRQTP